MEREKARVAYLDLSRFGRVLVTSDIHGDLKGFNKLLSELDFSDSDALIICGDILEKGDESLALLSEIVMMAKRGNTFALLGNNDIAFTYWRDGRATDEDMQRYLRHTEKSVLWDMLRALGLDDSDMGAAHRAVFERYAEEIAFLDNLPHIIETDFATFVHAGLEPLPLDEQDFHFNIGTKEFHKQKHSFPKPVIVGHWPISNYSERIISVAPIINRETNVISIDGGNSLKTWGQINCLVFDKSRCWTAHHTDSLPVIRCLEVQEETKNPQLILFPHTRCEVEKNDCCAARVYLPELDLKLTVPTEDIYDYRGTTYISDRFTYGFEVKPGDEFSLCEINRDCVVLKRNGTVGKYFGKWEYK
ncbi:MAG: metallophosphoesterase [Oscillospiraceae bacterium]|nr:metallophosphoesterase [Oscillospiraceae bacterium]